MPVTPPSIPSGTRVYAIGDVHGSLELLKKLLEKIDADIRKRKKATVRKVFLGDYIDRGLQSRGVIEYLIDLGKQDKDTIFLMGNHEQVMRSILLDQDKELLDSWLSFGGRETLMSYGVKPSVFTEGPKQLIEDLVEKTPANNLNFLKKLQISATFGDYFF